MLGFSASNAAISFSVILWRVSDPHQLKRRVTGPSEEACGVLPQPVRASERAAAAAAAFGNRDFRARNIIVCPLNDERLRPTRNRFPTARCDPEHTSRN